MNMFMYLVYLLQNLLLTSLPARIPQVSMFLKVLCSAITMNFLIRSEGIITSRRPENPVLVKWSGLVLLSISGKPLLKRSPLKLTFKIPVDSCWSYKSNTYYIRIQSYYTCMLFYQELTQRVSSNQK